MIEVEVEAEIAVVREYLKLEKEMRIEAEVANMAQEEEVKEMAQEVHQEAILQEHSIQEAEIHEAIDQKMKAVANVAILQRPSVN